MTTKASSTDPKTYRVPGPIAIALQTGRPELARLGVQAIGRSMTQADIDELSDYVESVVREIQLERKLVQEMYDQIRTTLQSWKGALSTFDRIEEAFRRMRNNEGPEAVRDAIRNPNRRENDD